MTLPDSPLPGLPVPGRHSREEPAPAVALPSSIYYAMAKMDFSALDASMDELPSEHIDAAAATLGKQSPLALTGLKANLYHHSNTVFIVLALAGMAVAYFSSLSTLGIVGCVALIGLGAAVVFGGGHLNKDVASVEELRVEMFGKRNSAEVSFTDDKLDPTWLKAITDLPDGDRKQWLDSVLRVKDSHTNLTWQLGVYNYIEDSTDSDGRSTSKRVEVPYAFFTHPSSITFPVSFTLKEKGFLSRTAVALSAAFDRKWSVKFMDGNLAEDSSQTRQTVTQLLTPDVQTMLIELLETKAPTFHFSPHGVVALGMDLKLDRLGVWKDPHQAIKEELLPLTAVIHEVYEQINPAFKRLKHG